MNTQIEFVEALQSHFAIEHVNDNIRVNLTQMAKPFGPKKSPGQWLRTSDAKESLAEISVMQKCITEDLLIVRQGGNPHYQGTWCTDYQVAQAYARWLSLRFSILIDRLFINLLTGKALLIEPFNDIEPVIFNRSSWYYYRAVLKSIGFSITSGSVAKRKKEHPDAFVKLFGRNFINLEYCHKLKQDALKFGIQLEINFTNIKQLKEHQV